MGQVRNEHVGGPGDRQLPRAAGSRGRPSRSGREGGAEGPVLAGGTVGYAVSRFLVCVPVVCLYVAACSLPAVKVDEGGHACTAIRLGTLPGVAALLLGWVPPLTVPWSANPLLLAGTVLFLCKKTRAALVCGAIAAVAGLTTWAFSGQWRGLLPGYYLWQASLAAFALGALVVHLWEGRGLRRRPQGATSGPRPGEAGRGRV